MKHKYSKVLIIGALFTLLFSVLMAIPSKAQISGVSIISLSAQCLALIGTTIAPAAFVECVTNDYYLTGLPGGSFVNTATAVAQDNKAYYGADYPGADSTSALIALTNSKLATLNRTQLILLAGNYDFWNNAVHASLP
ncbi:MAG: hypothetical protein FGM47_03615 [Candidatus Nanopelagicaceae bacterium]|nr:hypothetical protein [Candidatus Nanopelagicaceae bacterium]